MNNGKITILLMGVIILLGFIAYSNSLTGKFVWDDLLLIVDNAYIKNWSFITHIFSRDIGAGVAQESAFYRPIQMFTYLIDYSMWKFNVLGYHLVNIKFHILTALGIFWLINILFGNKALSFITSALFAIHPIHTEAVSYISGRSDPLAAIFMLLTFIIYIKITDAYDIKLCAAIIATYILAILSRENAMILPALLLLYNYTFKKRIELKAILPVAAIAVIYIILRLTVLKSLLANIYATPVFLQRIPGFFAAITNYMRLLILPFGLHMEYGRPTLSFLDPKAIAGLLILASSLVYAFRNRNKDNIVFFSIMWFFIALMPVSNLYPINAYMAEHWLYLPSIGFFLLLARGLNILYEKKAFKAAAIIIIAVLIVFWGALTMRQNGYWADAAEFYQRTLKNAPDSWRLYNNLGNVYKDSGRYEEAIAAYKKAIEIKGDFAEIYNNIGTAYYGMKRPEEAAGFFKKAMELNPRYSGSYFNLANIYKDSGNMQEAAALYEKSAQLDPTDARAFNRLGFIYYTEGRIDDAIDMYTRAIGINPGYVDTYNKLGIAYYVKGNKKKATELFKKAMAIDPGIASTYNNLGNIYRVTGRRIEALDLLKKAVALDPKDAEFHNNLGIAYYDIDKKEDAIKSYLKAIEIDPNFTFAYNNLGNAYRAAGKNTEAIAAYEKAIELKKDFIPAYGALAISYYDEKKYDLAIKYYDEALRLGQKSDEKFSELLKPHRKAE